MSKTSATSSLASVCEWCGLDDHGEAFSLDARFPEWQIQWEDQQIKGNQCPWRRQIKCRYGFVSNSGGSDRLLWACATKTRQAKRLVALSESAPEVFELKQHGDTEAAVEFHIDDINSVFSILTPTRR